MAGQEPQRIEEDSAPGAPAWMLTFSDCMTLLLTFFVLLLSFSSFDEMALRRLLGALKIKSAPSISDDEQRTDDSIARTVQSITDRTDKGAEKKCTFESLGVVRNPKESETILEADAYHEERVLNIPAGRLFLGDSNILTPRGRDCLKRIASFMKLMPCYVIIGAGGPHRSAPRAPGGADGGLLRSWAVLQFFTQRQGLPSGRFWISTERPRPLRSSGNESTTQIVLLARDITR